MKKTLTILFVLVSFLGYSQSTMPQFLGGKTTNLIVQGILNLADSSKASFNWVLADTATTKTYFSSNLKGRWARQSGRLYYNPSGLKFVVADSVTSSGGTAIVDSNVFVTVTRLSDSTAVLRSLITSPTFDTTNIYAQLALRVKYSDTGLMLSPYLRSSVANATYVPYTGATTNVNLGTHSLSAYDLIVNHTSGSGTAASISKGGNGEALTVVKSSGTGNAASITGGVTLLDELHLNTDLADAYIASASNWNAKVSTSQLADTAAAIRADFPIGGSGTVTSVATNNGTGITGGTITTTGTLSIDTTNTIATKLYRKKGDDSVAALVALKANIASPTFTGVPAAPTATAGTNTTQLATTAFVFAERTNTATLTNKTMTNPILNGARLGTTSTTGYVWTASDGLGNGSWAAGGGGGTDANAYHYTGDAFVGSMRLGASGTGTRRLSMYINSDTLLRIGVTSAGYRWAVINSNNGVANNYDATVLGGEAGNASGIRSVVIGGVGGQAQGTNSISMSSGIAESTNSWAWGLNSTYANGANSIAWGGYANNSNFTGCFNWSDFSEASFSSNTANNQFMVKAAGGLVFKTAAATTRMTIKSTGIVNISNTPTYADNTAALAGGLVAGDVYRTSTGVLMITY